MNVKQRFPYWNPYIIGVSIGILIILSFVITGRGLGAIGAFSSFVAAIMKGIAPEHTLMNPVFSEYFSGVDHPLKDWVVFEIAGVCPGGLISGLLSKRFKFEVIKGPQISSTNRLILAFASFVIGISAVFTNHANRNNLYPVWKYKTDRINKEKIRLVSANYLSEIPESLSGQVYNLSE